MAESLFRQTQKRRLELPEIQQASKKQKNDNPSEDDSDGDRPTSPTSRCPICLLVLNNRSYTDTCLHEFCFLCIKQWSQIKHECPLCKQTFRVIMHTIRALDDYEEYRLPPLVPAESSSSGLRHNSSVDVIGEEGFPYQIINSSNANLRFNLTMVGAPDSTSLAIFGQLPTSRRRPRRQYSLPADRREIYLRNLWVRPSTSQYRLSSPSFYRNNEALTHRLELWLTREVRTLVSLPVTPDRRPSLPGVSRVRGDNEDVEEFYVTYIVGRFMQHILQFPIRHPQMIGLAKLYFGTHGHHFIHEFYAFATSMYDMIGYDREAQYVASDMVDLTSPAPSTSRRTRTSPTEPEEDHVVLDLDWFVSVRQHRTRSAATSGNAGSVSTNQTGEEGNDSDDVICISPPPVEIVELSTGDEEGGREGPSTSRDNSSGQYVRSLPASPRVLSDNSASPRVLSDNSDSDYRPPAVPSPSRRPTARLPKRRRKPAPTRDDITGPSNNTPGPTRDDNRREHITSPSNNTRGYTSDPSDDEDYHPASELRRRWPAGESSRARRGSGQRASGKDSGQRARASQRRRSVILVSDSESGGEDASLRARLDSRLAKRRLARQAGEGVGGSESEGPVTNEIPGPSSFEDSSNMSSRVGDMGDSATRVGAMLGSSNRLSRVGSIGGASINSSLPISYTALPMYPLSSVVRPSTSAGNREAEWPLEVSDSDSSIESTRPGRSKTRREKSSQNELSSPAGRSKKSRGTEKGCKKSTKKINTNKEKSSRSTSHERSSTARSTKKSKSETSHKSKPDKSTKRKSCERRSSGERSSEYTNVTKSTNTGKKSKTKTCRKAKETTDSSPETSIKTKKSDRSSSEKSRKTKKSTISERSTQKSKRSQSSDSDTETPSSQRPTRLCKNQRPNFIASDSDDTSVSESEPYASNVRHSGPNSNEQSSGVFGARSGTSRKDAQYSRDFSPNSNEARSVKLGTRPTAKGHLAISSESDSDFGEELSAPHRESRKSENVEVREDSGTRSSGDIRQDSCDLGPKSSKRGTETRAKGGHLAMRNVHPKDRKTSSSKNKRLEDTKENSSYGNSKGGRKSGRENPESSRVRPKKTKKRKKKKSLRSAKKRKYVSDTSSEETDEESENDDFSHTDSFEEDNDDENGGSTLGGTSTGGRNGKVSEERRRERGTGGGRPLKSVNRGQQQCEETDRSEEPVNERANTSKAVSERATTSKAVSEKGDKSKEAFNDRADTYEAVSERATTSKTVSEKAYSKKPDGVKETVNKRENYDKRPDGFKETVNKRGNSVENGARNERVVETADCTLDSIEGSSNSSSSSIEDGDFQGVRASCDPSDSEDSSEQALDRAKYCRVVIENLANTLKNRETSIGSAAVRENCEVPSDDSLEQAEALDRAKYCRVVIEDLANTIRNGSGLGDNQTVTAPLRETQSPSEPFQTFASALRRVKDEVNPSDASPLNDVNVKHEMSPTEGEFQAETNINEIANPGSNEIADELAMNIPKIDEKVDLKRENASEEEKRGKDNAKKRSGSDHEAIENDGTDRRRKRKERKQIEKDQDGKRHRKDHREKRNVQRILGNCSQDRIYRGNNDRGEENFEEGHSRKDHQNRNCRGNDHRKGDYLENDQTENQPKREQKRHGRKRLENRSKSPSEASSDEFASNESDEFDLPQRFMHGSDSRSKPESTTASAVETSTYKELKSSKYDKTASGYVETSGYNEPKSSRHEASRYDEPKSSRHEETSGYNESKSSRYNEPESSRHEETSGYNEPKSSRYNEPKYSSHEETSGHNEPKSSRYNEPESSRHKTSSRFSVDNERPTCSKYLIADSERALPGIASFFCAESPEVDLTETPEIETPDVDLTGTPEVDTTAEQLSKKDTVQRSENGEYMLAMQMTEGQWLETSMKERGQWPSGGRASRPLTREGRWPQEDGTSINERDQRPLSIEEIINVEALDDEMVWKGGRRKAEQSGNRETLGDGVDGGAKQGTSVENGANGLECHANRVESCANPGRSNPVENAVSEDEPDVIIVNTPDVHAEILVLSSDDEAPRPLGLFSDRQSSYQHKKFQKAQRNSSARTDRENSHGDSNQETSGRSINSTSNEGSDVRACQQTRDEGDPNSNNQQNPIGSIDDAFGTSGSIGGSSFNTPRTISNTTYDDASNVQHALNRVVASKDVSPVDQIVHDINEDEVDVVGEIDRVVRASSRAIANTMSLLVRNSAILIQPSNQSTNLSETNQLVSSTRCASTNVSTKTTNQASSTSQSPSTNDSETNQSTSTKCTDISNVSSRTKRLAPRETNASNVYPSGSNQSSGSANAYSDDEIIEVGSPETLEILSTIETLANDIKDTVECMREHGKQKRRRQQRQRDRHGCRENNLGCRESNRENNIGCIESSRENNLGCRESNPGCSRENTHGCREKQVKRQNQEQLGESQVEACTRGVQNERLHQKSQEANGTPNEGLNVQEERTKHGARLNKLLGEDRFQDVENRKTIDNSNVGESKSEVDVHNTNEVNNKCDINGKNNKVSVHNIVMDAKTVETDISNIRNTKMTDDICDINIGNTKMTADISDINIGNTKMTADISDINIGNTKLEDDLKDINIDPTESIFQEHASVEATDAKPSTSNLHEHSRNEISNVSGIIKQLTSHHDEMTIEGKPNTNDDLPRKNKPIEPKPDEGNVSSAARTIGKHLQSVEYARIPFLTVEDEDVVLVTPRNTDLDVVDVDGSDDEPIICLESHGSQTTKPTGLDSLTYGRANQRHSMFSKRRYLKPGPDRLQTVSGPENDDVICVEDDVISVTDSQPMSDIDVVNTSPEALREIEAKETNRLDDSQSIQSTSASKSYIRKVLKWNRFWSEHKGSLGHVQPEGVTSASDDQMVTYRADNRGESFSGERHAGFTGEGSLSAVQTSPSGFDETAGGGRTDRRPFEESCSPSSWPGSGTALTSPVNYTIYENHTKQVVATRLVCDGEGRDSAERGSGRIMEITTKETYDVVKIAHKKKSHRIRTHALLGDGMSHALLGNQTRAVVSEENAMSHAPRQDSVVRASSSHEHHSVAESQERHGCRSPGIRHSCTKDRYPKSSSHGRNTAPVTMETLSREPTDDSYGELGSYYTPMDNRYLQYYHGYKDYKKRSSLYREEEETRQHSAHSENERELPSRDEKHVKCEVKSSSDVNVDEDSRGYHDDGCVVVKKKRKRRDRSSSDETNASTDSSVSPLKKRKRDSSRKKRKHSRKHSRRHGNETRHRKKSKHSRYHGDKVCVKRSKSPAHSSRSVSICSSQSKACSSKSSTFSSQSKSSNLSSQSKSSDRSSKSKSSNLSSQSKSSNLSSQSKGRSPKCSTVSSQSKSSERSSQSKPCKRLKLCDSDVKRRSHREKRFKFQSDAESDSDRKPPRASSTECDYRDAKTDSSRKRSKKHRHKQKRSCSPNHRSKRCSSSVSENDSSGFR